MPIPTAPPPWLRPSPGRRHSRPRASTPGPPARSPPAGARRPRAAGPEPAGVGAWLNDAELEEAPSADTWFTGTGPADARLAGAQAADAARVGEGPAVIGTGPYFADSGVESLTSEFPPRRPRWPEFSPADERWKAAHPTRRDNEAGAGSNSARPDPLNEPKHTRRPQPTWTEYPPNGFGSQGRPAGSGRVPLSAPVALALDGPETVGLLDDPYPEAAGETDSAAPGWGSVASLSEPDELFRAWQGSVDKAAAGRGSWSVPRRGALASRRRRALQVAAIGVPAAVIVTVGAGALMMLTGKANDMLAVQADTGSPTAHATGTSGATAGASASAAARPPAFVSATLSGYPGQRGSATVASMLAAAGMTLAVGNADGHPAIWRRAGNGSWTLESMASLGVMTGGTGLTSVAHGPAGWIAVGTAADGRATAAGRLRLRRRRPLAARHRADRPGRAGHRCSSGPPPAPRGYVVVGRQMVGGRIFAVLWYSADLRSWTVGTTAGWTAGCRRPPSTPSPRPRPASSPSARTARPRRSGPQPTASTGGSATLSAPSGADSATLRSVAVSGARVVAGGLRGRPGR